jgi:Secretion system C-terminal sorting domain/Photosynthesis system II assembly factor YCF48
MKRKFNIIFIALVVFTAFGFRGCAILLYSIIPYLMLSMWGIDVSDYSKSNSEFYKIAVGQNGAIFTSTGRESTNWIESQSGTSRNLNFVKASIPFGFISSVTVGDSGTLLVSSDNGITWTDRSVPNLNKDLYAFDFLYFPDPEPNYVVCGDSGIIYKSSNSGGVYTWQEINTNRNKRLNTIGAISEDVIIAAGEEGTILKTINGGNTWLDFSVSDTTINFNRMFLGLSVNAWNFVWLVGDNGKIFVSTDYGFEWNEKVSGTTENLYDVKFKNANEGAVAGANGVVRFTSDGGTTWNEDKFLSGLTQKDIISFTLVDSNTVSSLTVNNYNKYRKNSNRAGADSSFFLSVSTEPFVGVDDEENTTIKQYKLEQNYPNPFNPSTKINYSLSQFGLVTLKVYDLLGKEVSTLVNEEKNAGNYEVNFNGIGLPSGIYFYKLTAGNFTETKKLVLIK